MAVVKRFKKRVNVWTVHWDQNSDCSREVIVSFAAVIRVVTE